MVTPSARPMAASKRKNEIFMYFGSILFGIVKKVPLSIAYPSLPPLASLRSHRQDRFILAMLEHPTSEKAAAAAGVSDVTLLRSLQRPEFAEAYRKASREAFSQS